MGVQKGGKGGPGGDLAMRNGGPWGSLGGLGGSLGPPGESLGESIGGVWECGKKAGWSQLQLSTRNMQETNGNSNFLQGLVLVF